MDSDRGRKSVARFRGILILLLVMFVGLPAGWTQPKPLVVVQGIFPETLDPQLTTVQAALNAAEQVVEPLVQTAYEGGKVSIRPVLATAWKQVNPTIWRFTLRRGVRFHNGEPFNAEVVKFSIDRILDPKLKSPWLVDLNVIKEVRVVDQFTVDIVTKDPFPLFEISAPGIYVVPPKYTQETGTGFAARPVGTGPFRFVELVKDERAVLEANPNYWGGRPKVERVIFRGIPESGTRTSALRAGEADIVFPVSFDDAALIQREGRARSVGAATLRVMYVILDTTKPTPLASPKVRVALNYAIDKEAIIKHILGGNGVKLEGQLLTPEYFGFNPSLKAYPYNPDKAKQLLAEAGYPGGFSIDFYAPQGRYPKDKEVAEFIAGQLEKVGVKAKLTIMEWGTYIGQLLDKKLGPMAFLGWLVPPDAFYQFDAHVCGGTYSFYCNQVVDSVLKQASQIADEEQRLRLYRQIAAIHHVDPPVIFLYQPKVLYGVSNRITDWTPRPDERIELTTVRFK